MSYFRRFLWTRINRSTLQTFLLFLFSILCLFNLFASTCGSLRNNPSISIEENISSSTTETSKTEDFQIESGLELEQTFDFTDEVSSLDDYKLNDLLQLQTKLVQNKETSKDSSKKHLESSASNILIDEAESVIKRMTQKNEHQKKSSLKQPKKSFINDKDEELLSFLKNQDKKAGVNNVDIELDLTTIENAKESLRGAGENEIPATTVPPPEPDLMDHDEHDDFDDEEYYEDDLDEDDKIETLILNAEKSPGRIQELPYCKGTTTESTNQGTDQNSTSDDQIVLANKTKGFKFDGKQIVVATLDGNISFLDQSGKMHWSFSTGQFFSSTISSLQLTENGKLVKLIPSLTGGLYKYDGQNLQAMPLTADSLLRKSFKLASDVVITGGKEMRTFGLDINSGKAKYECGMNGCTSSPVNVEIPSSEEEESNKVVLVIKKQVQTVRAIESATGTERWNFSVATHELALAGLTEGCHQGASMPLEGSPKNHTAITKFFRMIIPEGMVFGADEGNKVVWQHKFESPISQAWVLEDGHLTIIDPIKCAPLMEELPSLYVGMHQKQMYVQESQTTAKKVKMAYELTHDELEDLEPVNINANQKRIEWKPLTVAVRNENTALSSIYNGPFYVYDREEVIYPAIEHNNASSKEDNTCATDDPEQDNEQNTELYDSGVIITIATLLFYWKEVLGISILTALILLVPVVRLVKNHTTRQLLRYFRQRLNAMAALKQDQEQKEQQALVLYNSSQGLSGTNSTTLSTPSSTTLENPLSGQLHRARTRTTSSSSNQSFVDDQGIPFVSQYIKEFEPIQCLGRGGFGVVFEARKKIDDRCYAVKRIPLPNRAKSRDRVMREVKALAKLDHRHIVRYFNAWIENPPMGWLEKNDPLWNQIVVNSPSPTSEYPSEFGTSMDLSVFPNLNSKLKKDYHEISLSGFTPDKENNDCNDDSFIVFATSDDELMNEDSIACTENNKSSVEDEVINIPSNNNNSDTNDSDEESESGSFLTNLKNKRNIYNNYNNSIENSKFFVRPTTLDIPSSSSNKSHPSDTSDQLDNDTNDSPLGIMYLYIQQELCQKRTLQEWLVTEKQREMRQVVQMFLQIVEAVEYIHSNKLIHRDLKPSNIFLAGGNGNGHEESDESNGNVNDKEMTIKIGDFGLVTTSAVNKLQDENDTNTFDLRSNVKLTGLVGTTLYMSYEQSQRRSYDHKVDIYSLGLILFEMIVPFSTNMERYDLLSKVRALRIPQEFIKNYPEEHKLIRQMVSHNPEKRPEASEIKYWLNQHLAALNSESTAMRNINLNTPWHRSKSSPSDRKRHETDKNDYHISKILKAHSFI